MDEKRKSRNVTSVLLGVSFAIILAMLSMSGGCGQKSQCVNELAFSPDGKWLAAGLHNWRDDVTSMLNWDDPIKCRDVGKTVELIEVQTPSNRRIVAQEMRYGIQSFFDTDTLQILFDPISKRLMFLLWSRGSLQSWDFDTKELTNIENERSRELETFAYSPDGKVFVTYNQTHTKVVTIWDRKANRELWSIDEIGSAPPISFSPDGSKIAVTGPKNDTVWDTQTGEVLFEFPEDSRYPIIRLLRHVIFSPDGRRFGVARHRGVRIWEIDQQEPGKTLDAGKLLPETKGFHLMAFSPDGKNIAIAGEYGIKVLNAESFDEQVFTDLKTGSRDPRTIAYSPDGKLIATGDGDGNVILWKSDNLERLETIRLRGKSRLNTMIPVCLLIVWAVLACYHSAFQTPDCLAYIFARIWLVR